jgi:hypothetical protein
MLFVMEQITLARRLARTNVRWMISRRSQYWGCHDLLSLDNNLNADVHEETR